MCFVVALYNENEYAHFIHTSNYIRVNRVLYNYEHVKITQRTNTFHYVQTTWTYASLKQSIKYIFHFKLLTATYCRGNVGKFLDEYYFRKQGFYEKYFADMNTEKMDCHPSSLFFKTIYIIATLYASTFISFTDRLSTSEQ